MINKGIQVQAVIHILSRCNQLLKRKNGTNDVKQEYYYWIYWLKDQFKYFHEIDENSKKKVLKTFNKSNEFLKKDIGNFKN